MDFDREVRLEFRGTHLSSDGGLLVMRELDAALGLPELASIALRDSRRGENPICPQSGALVTARYQDLISARDQATLPLNGTPPGECQLGATICRIGFDAGQSLAKF